MSLVLADSTIGRVIQLQGLLEQMEDLELQYKSVIGEMHYSTCWKILKTILTDKLIKNTRFEEKPYCDLCGDNTHNQSEH